MKKAAKAVAIVLVMILAICQIACSNIVKQAVVVMPKPNENAATLTIMLSPYEYDELTTNKFFIDYIYKFEKDFGVEVLYDKIGYSSGSLIDLKDRDEYFKKLSTKLYAKDGAELIFSESLSLEQLIEQGAVVKLNDKVPNIKNIYNGLLEDEIYFIPISVNYSSMILNLEALAAIGLKIPDMNWTSKDLFNIRTKWLQANKVNFNLHEWYVTFDAIINLDKSYDSKSNKITLDTPQIKQAIRDFRSYIFDGNYIINEKYKYENYYNLIFEEDSPEFQENYQLYYQNIQSNYIEAGVSENLLRSIEVERKNKTNGTVMMPKFTDKEVLFNANIFFVNKNGKNLELAYEFINGLLSDEVQSKIYADDRYRFYPVNKNIEDYIRKLEAEQVKDQRVVDTKEYVLNLMKNEQIKFWYTTNADFKYLKYAIQKDLATIILADKEYTDEEMSAKLREVQNKYNLFLNE